MNLGNYTEETQKEIDNVKLMSRFVPTKVNGFYQILDTEVSKFIALPNKSTGELKVIRKKSITAIGKIMASLQIAMEQHEKSKKEESNV